MSYNILLLGGGGREHAMAAHIVKSPKCDQLFIAPGNAGTSELGTNLDFAATDFASIRDAIIEQNIRMVLVGPEDPLVQGLVDQLHNDPLTKEVMVFGPEAAGAQLEGSKAFAKAFMDRAAIPTAAYREFSKDDEAATIEYLASLPCPIVIKADGLAAGKGVIIAQTNDEAIEATKEIYAGQFGDSGNKVVIEAFLDGIEFSVFVITNGFEYQVLPVAKDYKKIFEGDLGPNTGGMGAISPPPFVDEIMMEKVTSRVIEPTLAQLKKDGIPYVGFIFLGMIEVNGEPFVIEYNTRMGDPETEVVFPRIQSDMVQVFEDLILHNSLEPLIIDSNFAAGIYIVADGYPGDYSKGNEIDLEDFPDNAYHFMGGTKLNDNDKVVSNGGRVIFVGAMDPLLSEARSKALEAADAVVMEGKFYRRDIGADVDM